MTNPGCHPEQETNRERARTLLLKTLGVARVAKWCGVEEATVYQWISRGTELEPIPTQRVAAIVKGARAENLDAPVKVLWPAMDGI